MYILFLFWAGKDTKIGVEWEKVNNSSLYNLTYSGSLEVGYF